MSDNRPPGISKSSSEAISTLPNEARSGSEVGEALEPLRQRVEEEIKPLLEQSGRPNSEKIAKQVTAIAVGAIQQELFHGPLPHPNHFAAYESVVAGSATRILAMAELDQLHRQKLEKNAVTLEFTYAAAGLACGFLIAIGLIIAAVVAAIYDHELIAGAFVATSAIGMVTAFIKGRNLFGNNGPPASHPAAASPPPAKSRPKKARRS